MRSLLPTLAVVVSFGGPGSAATVSTNLGVRTACGSAPPESATLANEAGSVSLDGSSADCLSTATALAGLGTIGIGGSFDHTPSFFDLGATDAGVLQTIRGLTITPADGFTNAQLQAQYGSIISVTVNAHFSASVRASTTPGESPADPNAVSAGASIDARVSIENQRSELFLRANASTNPSIDETLSESFDGTLSATSNVFWLGDFDVSFQLNGAAGVGGQGNASASSSFDSLNSLGFVLGGPVFDLPDGFTINAPEVGIINNRWIDPNAPIDDGPAPVPLPAGLPLLGLAMFAIWGVGRRPR